MHNRLIRSGSLVAILAFALAGLAACSSDSDAKADSGASGPAAECASASDAYVKTIGDPATFKPVTADTLTVVTSLPGPGFFEGSDSDPTEITSGYEYDIAKKMQAAFGLKNLVIRNESFDAIVAGQVSDYDVAFSQISITCDRAKVVDFSTGYFKSDQGLLVKKGTAVASWDDVKAMTIGVQASTTAEWYFTSGEVPGWTLENVKSFPDLASAYAALNAGQVDGVVVHQFSFGHDGFRPQADLRSFRNGISQNITR